MTRWLLLMALVLLSCGRGQSTIAGVSGLTEPRQTRLDKPVVVATIGEFTVTAVETYEVEALVLSTCRYRWDGAASVSPVDLLLAWGPVAAGDSPNQIRWSQSGRWGRYRFDYANTALRRSTIDRHTANTHIIPDPADPELRRRVLRVRRGDTVRLEGFLVNVSGPKGWRWSTSRSRRDSGGGACEILFVTAMLPRDSRTAGTGAATQQAATR